ncbi:zinc dependent phospholipase C family protein [Anaerofustis butyriciformans]|uniref:zinc dependent phospholipase C family protein n=1 Tax=Anaerofustis butyriciformans TaxID=3108533 RepID=UPI002E35BB33|nr:zinc dependent phospholipase C family protein [Anaerofustis sp. HA2171]
MPGITAHYIFGQKVLDKYPKEIKNIVIENKDLFNIGLQGPDILFYYKPLKSNNVTKFGNDMHDEKGSIFFNSAIDTLHSIEEENFNKYLSYLLGFLCHFTFDSNAHGYIENKIYTSKVTHYDIEWEFERYLMKKNNIDPKKKQRLNWINISKENSKIISDFYKGITPDEIFHSINSISFYDSFLLGAHLWQRELVSFVLHISGQYKSKNKLRMQKEPIKLCLDSNLRLEKIMNNSINKCIENTNILIDKLDNNTSLSKAFDKTFGPNENWQDILVLSLEEEEKYEIEI